MNIQYNIELKPYNSFRTKAIAKLFAQPATVKVTDVAFCKKKLPFHKGNKIYNVFMELY